MSRLKKKHKRYDYSIMIRTIYYSKFFPYNKENTIWTSNQNESF